MEKVKFSFGLGRGLEIIYFNNFIIYKPMFKLNGFGEEINQDKVSVKTDYSGNILGFSVCLYLKREMDLDRDFETEREPWEFF